MTAFAEANASRMRGAQAAATERRRATGRHPMHDPAVRRKIASTQREQWAKRQAVENQPVSSYTDFNYRHHKVSRSSSAYQFGGSLRLRGCQSRMPTRFAPVRSSLIGGIGPRCTSRV